MIERNNENGMRGEQPRGLAPLVPLPPTCSPADCELLF